MHMESEFPNVGTSQIAWISESDMIEVDRIMIEDLRIELLQMMENAGRNLARLVLGRFGPRQVTVVVGSGGNGGGGMVAARHLANAGVDVVVTATRRAEELSGVPAHQFDILCRMGIERVDEVRPADVVVDAVIGYSLRGAPSGRSADLIEQINATDAVVVSLDTPSGLDVTSGTSPGVVVQADATLTLCLPKLGLRDATNAGELYVADISVPPSVTATFGSPAPDFSSTSILAIDASS